MASEAREGMPRREYVYALWRGFNAVARGMGEVDRTKRRILILDGVIRILQCHEQYTRATVGAAEILKPLILAAADDEDRSDGFLWAFIRAIETTHSITPSVQSWRSQR